MRTKRYKAITSLQARKLGNDRQGLEGSRFGAWLRILANFPCGTSATAKCHNRRLPRNYPARNIAQRFASTCSTEVAARWNCQTLGHSREPPASYVFRPHEPSVQMRGIVFLRTKAAPLQPALPALRAFPEKLERMPDIGKTVALSDRLFHFLDRTRVHHQSHSAALGANQVIVVLLRVQQLEVAT
jgi:hypothetical protein